MNGHNARSGGGPHLLYDGGQLGLLKFPVSRQRPPYEVLYTQLGLSRLVEYIQLGLLKTDRVLNMKDLQDAGCVSRVKYGVLLYGKVWTSGQWRAQVLAAWASRGKGEGAFPILPAAASLFLSGTLRAV